ncbi:LysR substrate-binding domain-containing protein [Actinokineospora soli]
MSLSLPSVRAFVAVAREGSFRGAAALLKVSQPTVSAAVARLESIAEGPLLLRGRDGIVLTELGERVLAGAEHVVAAADDLETAIAGTVTAGLTLGFMGEAAATATRGVIDVVRKHGGDDVRLRRYDFEDPSCGLLSGQTDLAIVWPPVSTRALETLVITSDRRGVALPVNDPLVSRAELTPAELAGRTWVVPFSPDAGWRAFRHPNAVGVDDVAGTVTSGAIEETLELVAAGVGIAVMSESTEQHYARAGVVVVPLASGERCTAALAWRRGDGRSAVAKVVSELRVHSGSPDRAR